MLPHVSFPEKYAVYHGQYITPRVLGCKIRSLVIIIIYKPKQFLNHIQSMCRVYLTSRYTIFQVNITGQFVLNQRTTQTRLHLRRELSSP